MPQSGLVQKEVPGFLGVNLRQDRMDLADEELARAINVDLHTFPGVIVLRLGRTQQFSTALTEVIIRRLAKINGRRYRVAETSVYRDQTKILAGLSSNLITTIIPFRPLNDDTEWAFIADDALMRKDDGTDTRIWGIAAPTTAPILAIGPAGGLGTGNYSVRYTFVRKTKAGKVAHESNPSLTSDVVDPATGHIVASNFEDTSDSQVTHLRFYRTLVGQTDHLLESEIPFGSEAFGYAFSWEANEQDGDNEFKFTQGALSSTYEVCFLWEKNHLESAFITTNSLPISTTSALAWILSIADTALGAAVETDNDPPPNASWAVSYNEHIFFMRDAANPHYLWFSKRFRPESVPLAQFLEIGNPSDPLQCAVSGYGLCAVFSRLTKYRVTGNSVSGFVSTEAKDHRGTPAPLAAIGTPKGILFVARDGIFITSCDAQDSDITGKILPLFVNEVVNDMLPINWDEAKRQSAGYYKNRYYLGYSEANAVFPNRIAVYSFDTQRWYFYDHPMSSLFVEEDIDKFTAGGQDGFVYFLEDGSTDGTSDISMNVETKNYYGEQKTTRKLFLLLKVDADTLGDALSVDFFVDNALKHTASITGTRTKKLLPLPEKLMGYSWRIRFRYTGSKRIKIYAVAAFWLPLSAS